MGNTDFYFLPLFSAFIVAGLFYVYRIRVGQNIYYYYYGLCYNGDGEQVSNFVVSRTFSI